MSKGTGTRLILGKTYRSAKAPSAKDLKDMKVRNMAAVAKFKDHPYAVKPELKTLDGQEK